MILRPGGRYVLAKPDLTKKKIQSFLAHKHAVSEGANQCTDDDAVLAQNKFLAQHAELFQSFMTPPNADVQVLATEPSAPAPSTSLEVPSPAPPQTLLDPAESAAAAPASAPAGEANVDTHSGEHVESVMAVDSVGPSGCIDASTIDKGSSRWNCDGDGCGLVFPTRDTMRSHVKEPNPARP